MSTCVLSNCLKNIKCDRDFFLCFFLIYLFEDYKVQYVFPSFDVISCCLLLKVLHITPNFVLIWSGLVCHSMFSLCSVIQLTKPGLNPLEVDSELLKYPYRHRVSNSEPKHTQFQISITRPQIGKPKTIQCSVQQL